MRVRVGISYIFYPNGLDRCDGRTALIPGDIVKVVNLPGAPKCNTMNHAHVSIDGKFGGMVHTGSLYPLEDAAIVVDAIKADIAAKEAKRASAPVVHTQDGEGRPIVGGVTTDEASRRGIALFE